MVINMYSIILVCKMQDGLHKTFLKMKKSKLFSRTYSIFAHPG